MTDETDLDRAKIEDFAEEYGFTFPVGYTAADLLEKLGIVGFPTYYVFGKDGHLVWSGHSSGSDLSSAIETALEADQ